MASLGLLGHGGTRNMEGLSIATLVGRLALLLGRLGAVARVTVLFELAGRRIVGAGEVTVVTTWARVLRGEGANKTVALVAAAGLMGVVVTVVLVRAAVRASGVGWLRRRSVVHGASGVVAVVAAVVLKVGKGWRGSEEEGDDGRRGEHGK